MIRDRVVVLVPSRPSRAARRPGRWPALAAGFTVEPPRDPRHGDFAVNAAMVLAKPAGRPPRELAQAIVEAVRAGDGGERRRRRSSCRARGSSTSGWRPDVWLRALGERGAAGRVVRANRGGEGPEGDRGVRVGEPDRAHARRSRAQRGDRGRGGAPARAGAGTT